MVKLENANFSLPEVPPGFQPLPPKTCSAAAAAEPSRNQNSTSKENEQSQRHDISAEQPSPRRISRKRSRPQFYEPPTAPKRPTLSRRRGRPPKVLSTTQISHQTETRNSNQTSSTPLRRPEKQISCFISSFQSTKEQSSSANNQVGGHGSRVNFSPLPHHLVGRKKNRKSHAISVDINRTKTTSHAQDIIDIPLSEGPGHVSGYERVGNVCHNSQISDSIDPKILQHVANALHYMTGGQTSLNDTEVRSRNSDVDKNLAHTLTAINRKHGDITQHCSLESDCMKSLVLLGICKVVLELQKKELKDIDISSLDSCYTAVRDAENMKVNVQWLRNRLDEIKNAVLMANEARGLLNERNRHLENIDRKKNELLLRKVELERLNSEVQDIEEQLAQEVAMLEELNKKFGDQTSKISQFEHSYLMDGLI